MNSTNTIEEEQTKKTLDVDLKLALDALVGAWEESDGQSHVLAIHHDDDGMFDEHYVTYEVRSHDRHEDCVHVHDLFDYSHIDGGEVVEHTTADTLTFAGEEYNVHLW